MPSPPLSSADQILSSEHTNLCVYPIRGFLSFLSKSLEHHLIGWPNICKYIWPIFEIKTWKWKLTITKLGILRLTWNEEYTHYQSFRHILVCLIDHQQWHIFCAVFCICVVLCCVCFVVLLFGWIYILYPQHWHISLTILCFVVLYCVCCVVWLNLYFTWILARLLHFPHSSVLCCASHGNVKSPEQIGVSSQQ